MASAGAQATVSSRRTVSAMDPSVSVFVLLISAAVGVQNEGMKERSFRGVYQHYDEEFEPIAFAAVPLHQPMPVLRIVSTSPKYKFGVPYEIEEPTRYYRQPAHSASMMESRVTEPSDLSSEEQAAEVVYARPNKRGGFSYRRQPAPRRPTSEPVLIRVHKYKVVRDR